MGTVAQLKKEDMPHGEANLKTNGDLEHIAEPKEELSLMAKASEKSGEEIKVTKGFLLLVGFVPVFLSLILQYGGSLVGWAREDQSKILNIQQVQNDQQETRRQMESLNNKIDEMQKTLRERDLKDARIEGYKLGQMENDKK